MRNGGLLILLVKMALVEAQMLKYCADQVRREVRESDKLFWLGRSAMYCEMHRMLMMAVALEEKLLREDAARVFGARAASGGGGAG